MLSLWSPSFVPIPHPPPPLPSSPPSHPCSQEGFVRRAVATGMCLAGLALLALLVGGASDAVGSKMEALREGHLPVVERGHVVIAGRKGGRQGGREVALLVCF